MIKIVLTAEQLRDLVAGKVVSWNAPGGTPIDNPLKNFCQITVRELPVHELLRAVAAGIDLLAADMDEDFGERFKEET